MAIRYAPSFQALDDFMMFRNRKHKNYPVWVEEAEKRRQELAREYLKRTLDGFPLGSGKSKLKLAVILGDMLKGILGQNV